MTYSSNQRDTNTFPGGGPRISSKNLKIKQENVSSKITGQSTLETNMLLKQILSELQKMNVHLSIISDEEEV